MEAGDPANPINIDADAEHARTECWTNDPDRDDRYIRP